MTEILQIRKVLPPSDRSYCEHIKAYCRREIGQAMIELLAKSNGAPVVVVYREKQRVDDIPSVPLDVFEVTVRLDGLPEREPK